MGPGDMMLAILLACCRCLEITGGSGDTMVEEGGDMELACDHGAEGWNMCAWSREAGDMSCITYSIAEDEELKCKAPNKARVIGTADSCTVSLGQCLLMRLNHGLF